MATNDWTVAGTSPDPAPAQQWKVVGTSAVPETFGHALAGAGDLALTGVANVIPAIVNAGDDILKQAAGEPSSAGGGRVMQPWAHVGEAGNDLVQYVSHLPGGHDATGAPLTVGQDISDSLSRAKNAANGVAEELGVPANDVAGVDRFVGNAAQFLPGLDAAGGAASGIARGIGGAVRGAMEEAPTEAPWYKAGLRTGEGHAVARNVAGDSAQETVAGNNQRVAQSIVAAEAGHPVDQPMSYESLADARAAPSAVYNRVANVLPDDGQLNAAARAKIENAGLPEGGRMTAGSPQAQTQIAALKQQLLDPSRTFTGNQMVNEMRALRQEGFLNAASEDVDKQNLGKAQLDMARAIEGHVEDSLPANGPVSIEQFRDARQQLAKNWAAQGILRGGDVDLKALARMQRNDPDLLTGGYKMLADFANGEGKNVVNIPNKFNPPSVVRDLAGMINMHRIAQSTLQAVPGVGTLARRALIGDPEENVAAARAMFPGGDPARFAPLELRPPEPPAGLTAATPAAPAPAARPSLGDFAAVLSQGVGERLPEGLSVGPMGVPAGTGDLTYHPSPEVFGAQPVHGGSPPLLPRFMDDYGNEVNPNAPPPNPRVKLGDRIAGGSNPQPAAPNSGSPRLGDRFAPTRSGGPDLAAVQAEGVPTGTTMRTAPQPAVQHVADEETGAHTVTSANGATHGQESGPYLIVKRSDTAAGAQGNGEGTARMEAMLQQAEHRGLSLGSDVSVSPAQQRVYAALERKGYRVIKNPATVNPNTGNLVSNDPRVPVFVVKSRLAQAVGQ